VTKASPGPASPVASSSITTFAAGLRGLETGYTLLSRVALFGASSPPSRVGSGPAALLRSPFPAGANPKRFIVARGHEMPEVEFVVEDNRRFLTVEKTVETGFMAESDPRSGAGG
jgi:hypothetical protein